MSKELDSCKTDMEAQKKTIVDFHEIYDTLKTVEKAKSSMKNAKTEAKKEALLEKFKKDFSKIYDLLGQYIDQHELRLKAAKKYREYISRKKEGHTKLEDWCF